MAGSTTRSGVWMSRQPFGPWTLQKPARLDLLKVPKTAPFTDGRRIFAGFLEDRGWGGNLAFRELVQHEDGTLGTKFPPEMIPECGTPLDLPFEALGSGVSGNGKTVSFSAPGGIETGMLAGTPQNVRITCKVEAHGDSPAFGLRMRASANNEDGCELRFEPSRQRVQFDTPHRGQWGVESEAAILDVEGLDRPFTFDIFLKDDVVDVCIDDRRTTVSRCWSPNGDRLFVRSERRRDLWLHRSATLDRIAARSAVRRLPDNTIRTGSLCREAYAR